jgi:NADH dehydrogenase FAD-containing subunit
MPFKNLSTTKQTKDALHDWAKRIEAAESIVVAGAGLTGIEVAGELGQEYATTGKKKITLICDQDLPLTSNFKRDVRETAKTELERLKVTVITHAKVTSPASSTTKTITLSKKTSPTEKATTTTLSADLLIPTYGAIPNTSFLPPSMLDTRGFVKQTTRLRAEGHENIFVVGDAGNLEVPQGVHADAQTVHVVKLIEAQLLGQEAAVGEYKPAGKIMFAATLGKNTGTGQVGGWKVWGWLVKRIKGRYLGTDSAAAVARGERTLTVKAW